MKSSFSHFFIVRWAGALLVSLALAFVGVFSALAVRFNYPDVLEASGHLVLPQLLAGGATLRGLWLVYALLPLLILPITSMLLHQFEGARITRQLFGSMGMLALLTLTLGLIRWPSLQWQLAEAYASGSPMVQAAVVTQYDAANQYLGVYIGELLGEIFLYGWIGLGIVLAASRLPRWAIVVGLVTAASGEIGAWRPFSEVSQSFADLNNVLLPIGLIAWGVGLMVGRKST